MNMLLGIVGVVIIAFIAYLGPYAWYSNKVTREGLERFCAELKPGAPFDMKGIEERAKAQSYEVLASMARNDVGMKPPEKISVNARSANGRWWCAIEQRDGTIVAVNIRGRTLAD